MLRIDWREVCCMSLTIYYICLWDVQCEHIHLLFRIDFSQKSGIPSGFFLITYLFFEIDKLANFAEFALICFSRWNFHKRFYKVVAFQPYQERPEIRHTKKFISKNKIRSIVGPVPLYEQILPLMWAKCNEIYSMLAAYNPKVVMRPIVCLFLCWQC